MMAPGNNRLYFYRPRDGGIEYFAGNTANVQGPFTSFTGAVTENSFLAAVYDPDPVGGNRRLYVAADNFNRQKGITLFNVRLASGTLINRGRVTPDGVDARYPALVYDDNKVWLLYNMAHEYGEDIFRRRITGNGAEGEPERLLTAAQGSGARPLGYYTINGVPLLIWHETGSGTVFGAWEGGPAFVIQLDGSADRITLYGPAANGSLRAAIEKNGTISFGAINLNYIPAPPVIAPPEPDPGPYQDPDGGEGNGYPDGGENDGYDGGEAYVPDAGPPEPDDNNDGQVIEEENNS
jgi:hypothetical protein